MKFVIKKGDTYTALSATLKDIDGPVNLSGATVVFSMETTSGVSKVSAQSVTISEQTLFPGQVSYAWQPADVNTAGRYRGEFVVTFGNGKQATFPRGGVGTKQFIQIEIQDDV